MPLRSLKWPGTILARRLYLVAELRRAIDSAKEGQLTSRQQSVYSATCALRSRLAPLHVGVATKNATRIRCTAVAIKGRLFMPEGFE